MMSYNSYFKSFGRAKYMRYALLCLIVPVLLHFIIFFVQCRKTISKRMQCHYGTCNNVSKGRKCDTFPRNIEENIRVISDYRFSIDTDHLERLHLDSNRIERLSAMDYTPTLPVIVTGASENHFPETQALFENIHLQVLPKYRNLKIIFYDLGLGYKSRHLLQKYCKCEVRTFPFHEYPIHVSKLSTYTWKPIIIQLVLKEFASVIWADASVRFTRPNLESFFFNSTDLGIKVYPGWGSIAQRTQLETFHYLGENPCLFDVPEKEATVVFVKRSQFTLKYIIRPWVSCALATGCMAHPCSSLMFLCTTKSLEFGCCHRFDQSIIGIILTRLFHSQTERLHVNTSQIQCKRGHFSEYFYYLESRNHDGTLMYSYRLISDYV